jgi:hypothetical protein
VAWGSPGKIRLAVQAPEGASATKKFRRAGTCRLVKNCEIESGQTDGDQPVLQITDKSHISDETEHPNCSTAAEPCETIAE